jgi:hypothetical protein
VPYDLCEHPLAAPPGHGEHTEEQRCHRPHLDKGVVDRSFGVERHEATPRCSHDPIDVLGAMAEREVVAIDFADHQARCARDHTAQWQLQSQRHRAVQTKKHGSSFRI